MSPDGRSLQVVYVYRNPDNTPDMQLASSSDASSFTFERITERPIPSAFDVPAGRPLHHPDVPGRVHANVSAGGHRFYAWGDNCDVVTRFLYPQGRPDPTCSRQAVTLRDRRRVPGAASDQLDGPV